MKKHIFILVMALAIPLFAGAQKKELNSASSSLNKGELDKAWQSIEAAINNDETKNLPKTWLTRGKILQSMASSTDTKYNALVEDPLFEAYKSYQKAIELDDKKKVNKEIDMTYLQMVNVGTNKGIDEFKAAKYDKSLKYFELVLKLEESPIFKNTIDTSVIYDAGLAAKGAKEYDKAVDYFNKLIQYNYAGSTTYLLLKDTYFEKGDSTNGLATIKKAFEKYPEDVNVINELINYYLIKGEGEQALNYIKLAKEKERDNKLLFFAEGVTYEKLNQFDSAKASYMESVKVDPNYFDGYYYLGRLYYNKAVEVNQLASNEKDDNKYNELQAKRDSLFKESIPYFEKAHEINKTDKDCADALKGLYFRFQEKDKLDKLKQEMGW